MSGSFARATLRAACVASALAGCAAGAASAPPATAAAPSALPPAPRAAPPAAGVEHLPARAPLVARIDVAALRALELLDLFGSALELNDEDAAALEAASVAWLSVEPAAGDARIVLVLDRARCVRSCAGYAPSVEALGQPNDLRAGLVQAAGASELVVVRAAVPRDASGDALREVLLESPVGVLSELRDAELRVERGQAEAGALLRASLHARLANKGLASGLGLLLRDVTLKAADELDAVDLGAPARQLEALHLDVGEPEGAGDALTVALDAELALSAAALPAVVLAFKKSRERERELQE